MSAFNPTQEQQGIIELDGSAFVTACPGAGKTRTLVERARHIFTTEPTKNIAFLSFTTQAVSELETRLIQQRILPSPIFPNFIGTFDAFLWQFFSSPLGVRDSAIIPKMIPDKGKWIVCPPHHQRTTKLEHYDRATGTFCADRLQSRDFNPGERTAHYEAKARTIINDAATKSHLDFEDVRKLALRLLENEEFKAKLGNALCARFDEIIVDEAQDCNRDDLTIIQWLRDAGLPTKVICDPQQAVYEFRGGVTDELLAFRESFPEEQRKSLTGNFRSTPAICKTIVGLRPSALRTEQDESLGHAAQIETPIHILAYSGGVTAKIGQRFEQLLTEHGLKAADCPILAATWATACNAAGQQAISDSKHNTLRLANAIAMFHSANEAASRKQAVEQMHEILLNVTGSLNANSYGEYIARDEIQAAEWRPKVSELIQSLRHDSETETADQWLARARDAVSNSMPLQHGATIAQSLRNNGDLAATLTPSDQGACLAQSIHAVKGSEFPGICLVMTSQTTKGILDFLIDDATNGKDEDARKVYVGASRAEQLLAIAVPKSRSQQLSSHLNSVGASTETTEIL